MSDVDRVEVGKSVVFLDNDNRCAVQYNGNLQKPAARQHSLLANTMKCTTARITIPDRLPRTALLDILLPSTVENQLGRRRQRLTIAQWNVRTLLDRKVADRPERRTALVAMELAKYNIDVAASTTWNTLSSGVGNPKEKERRPE